MSHAGKYFVEARVQETEEGERFLGAGMATSPFQDAQRITFFFLQIKLETFHVLRRTGAMQRGF